MANKIQIEITVDDKGGVKTLKQVGDATKQVGEDAKQAGSKSSEAFSAASGSIKTKWLAMTAAVGAATYALYKGFELLEHGAKEKQVEEAFHNVAKSYGQDADKIVAAMDRAVAGTINGSDLMQKAVKGMTQGLSGDDMVKIAEMARVAARTTGQDVSVMFDQISDAVANQMPRALKTLGLVYKEELKILEDAVANGVEGVKLLDLAFLNATISGEAMGKMAKNDAESFQQLKAVGMEMYDELSKGALAYAKSLLTLGQGDMALAGLSPGGMGKPLQADPKATEKSAKSAPTDQRKKSLLDEIKSDTARAKAQKDVAKGAEAAIKAAEAEAAVYSEMFDRSAKAYTHEFQMQKDIAKAKDDWLQEYLEGIESAERAEQERSERLGELALAGQKAAESSLKDRADAYRTMYGDIGKTTQASYKYKLGLLDDEYAKLRGMLGDSAELQQAYANRKKELDREMTLSSDDFFGGIKVGYRDMLDSQKTWARAGLEVFNGFTTASQTMFSSLFNDLFKGDLKSFDEYWDSFCGDLLTSFATTLATMATEKLSKYVAAGVTTVGGWAADAALEWLGDQFAGPIVYHEGAYRVGDESAGGLLGNDEYMGILQKGEMVIPKEVAEEIRQLMSGGSGGSFGDFGTSGVGAISQVGISTYGGTNLSGVDLGGLAMSAGKSVALGLLSGQSFSDIALGAMRGGVQGRTIGGISSALSNTIGKDLGISVSTLGATLGASALGLLGLGPMGAILGAVLGALGFGAMGFGNAANTSGFAQWGDFNPNDIAAKSILGSLAPDVAAVLASIAADTFGDSNVGSGFAQGGNTPSRGYGGGDGGYGVQDGNYGGGNYGGQSAGGGSMGIGGEGAPFAYGGLATGPESGYMARLHGTELVVSQKKGVSAKVAGGDYSELVAEIKALRETMAAGNYASVKSLAKMVKILDRFDNDGMPAERVL